MGWNAGCGAKYSAECAFAIGVTREPSSSCATCAAVPETAGLEPTSSGCPPGDHAAGCDHPDSLLQDLPRVPGEADTVDWRPPWPGSPPRQGGHKGPLHLSTGIRTLLGRPLTSRPAVRVLLGEPLKKPRTSRRVLVYAEPRLRERPGLRVWALGRKELRHFQPTARFSGSKESFRGPNVNVGVASGPRRKRPRTLEISGKRTPQS